MNEHQANRAEAAEQTGTQHPDGGPIAGAGFCPHCHRQALLNGMCRECDWPG